MTGTDETETETGEGRSRFFFAHVQKAAGTSLFLRLQRHFEAGQIYPDKRAAAPTDSDGAPPALPRLSSTLLVSQLLERYAACRREIRIVTGHFPLRTTEMLGDDFVTLTLLRDPVERTLSALRHQQVKTPADRDTPLEALYDDPIRFHGLIHNHMVKMFSLSPEEIRTGDGVMAHIASFTPDRLEDAKARLAAVDVLGLHDHLDEFCAELTARFGWRLGARVHANQTEPIMVSSSFRARIATDNALDADLYEHARAVWASRRAIRTPGSRHPAAS